MKATKIQKDLDKAIQKFVKKHGVEPRIYDINDESIIMCASFTRKDGLLKMKEPIMQVRHNWPING